MPRRVVCTVAIGAVALLSALAVPPSSWAGGPGKWTKLATIDNGADTFGIARTADGDLHLVWLEKRAPNTTYGYGASTISQAGKLLATKTVFSNWKTLEPDPQLVKDGSGLRLIFEGNTGSSTSCYEKAEVFTATSSNGSSWSPVFNGSMDQDTVGVGNIAATTESDGTTPVVTFAAGQRFHVGVDPNCPATQPDGMIPVTTGNTPSNPAIVTASNGSIWVATYQAFQKQGYFVAQILPSLVSYKEAPDSKPPPAHNNQPLEPVALAARAGGGVYMAYCVANNSQPCVNIDLWKVGSSKAMKVPGSKNTGSARVSLAAAPGGRLAVTWFNAPNGDVTKSVIHTVRTNTSATSFGIVRTIKTPPHTVGFNDIQTQDSTGRLDVLVNAEIQMGSSFPIELWQTQILPGLSLKASPHKFSHTKAATVTFTVADAGEPVAGAKVSCLGKHGTTSTAGQAKLHFKKGTAAGKHVCTASKGGYAAGKTTLKVT